MASSEQEWGKVVTQLRVDLGLDAAITSATVEMGDDGAVICAVIEVGPPGARQRYGFRFRDVAQADAFADIGNQARMHLLNERHKMERARKEFIRPIQEQVHEDDDTTQEWDGTSDRRNDDERRGTERRKPDLS